MDNSWIQMRPGMLSVQEMQRHPADASGIRTHADVSQHATGPSDAAASMISPHD
jgi:hypothetical protein